METINLQEKEFKSLIIRMLDKLRERIDYLSDNFKKEFTLK